MADEVLVAGLEKVQVDGTPQTGNLKASEEKGIVPEKLQCDSSESDDSGLEKEKDASLVKGGSQGGKKKKLPKKIKKKKKATKKNKGDANTADKLQCHSSDSKSGSGDDNSDSKSGSGDDSSKSKSGSGDDSKYESGSVKVKDASLVKGGSQGGKKKKLPKTIKKKMATKKNKGEASTTDKLQCHSSDSKSGSGDDSSDSKSGSGDDSSKSKSGSGDDSKSESGSSNKSLQAELKQTEKKKGLIERIREKLSRKPTEETAEVSTEEVSEAKGEDKQNLDKLQCDGSESKSGCIGDSGSESCLAKERDTSALKVGNKGEKKKKVLRKKIKKATKKNKGEASTDGKLHCDSDSKSGSGDGSSGSKSGSGDDSGGSKSGSGDDSKSESGPTVSAKKEKNGEENQTATQLVAAPGTKVDEAIAAENSEVMQEIGEGQNAGKEVKDDEGSGLGEKAKKSILGKIMEKLPGYYKNGGE